MEELRQLAQGELIGGFVENPPYPLSLENVSGVSLRIDDYWLSWHQYNSTLRSIPISPISQRAMRTFAGTRYDFTVKPPNWSEHCKQRGYRIADAHPVLVVVILRKPLDRQLFADAPWSVGPHPIVYEHRPEAVGYSVNCGDFIGCSGDGTVGGFLWNSSDMTYHGMSCAHVLGPVANPGQSPARAHSPRPNIFRRSHRDWNGHIFEIPYLGRRHQM
jgi:hypothetical protein